MKKTPALSVFLAFLVVALPLGWGLYRSIRNSVPLFTASRAPVVAPAVGPAAASAGAPAVMRISPTRLPR
jgi:hypothetical protein